MLTFGLSQILIPMFVIAEPFSGRTPDWVFASALLALAAAVGSLLSGRLVFIAVASVIGLAVVDLHVRQMETILAKRIRRRLGGEFLLIRLSWIMLSVSLALASGLALDLLPPTAPALFGFVTLFGWLLSVVMGVQQRILPFLGSMHAARAGRRPLAPTKLVHERSVQVHRWCHVTALAGVSVGIIVPEPAIIAVGGVFGAVGAVAYAAFAVRLCRRTLNHLGATAAPAEKRQP